MKNEKGMKVEFWTRILCLKADFMRRSTRKSQLIFPYLVGCAPAPEEVLLAVRVTEDKIALKSGYNKYLKVCSDNIVRGISDAVGATEQWEPIFQVLFRRLIFLSIVCVIDILSKSIPHLIITV